MPARRCPRHEAQIAALTKQLGQTQAYLQIEQERGAVLRRSHEPVERDPSPLWYAERGKMAGLVDRIEVAVLDLQQHVRALLAQPPAGRTLRRRRPSARGPRRARTRGRSRR